MKLIKEIKYSNHIDYIYENNVLKRIWNNKEIKEIHIFWHDILHNENGAAIQNCHCCTTKYKKHFCLGGYYFSPKDFAQRTKHRICLICNNFCNQQCFIGEI